MKYFVGLLLLVALTVSSGVLTSSSLKLEKGKQNQISFACGAIDRKTGRTGVYTDNYTYTFKDHPTWLTPKGNSLVGTVPTSANGDYSITVSYRSQDGKKFGQNVFVLTGNTAQATAPTSTASSTSKTTSTSSTTHTSEGGLLGAVVNGVKGLLGIGQTTKTAPQTSTANAHRYSYFQGIYDTKRVASTGPGNLVVLCPILPSTETFTKPIITEATSTPNPATTSTDIKPTTNNQNPTITTSTTTTPPVVVQPPVVTQTADNSTVTPADPVAVPPLDPNALPDIDPATLPVDPALLPPVDPITVPVDTSTVPIDPIPVDPAAVPPIDPAAVVPVDPSSVPPVDPSSVAPVDPVAAPANIPSVVSTPVSSTPTAPTPASITSGTSQVKTTPSSSSSTPTSKPTPSKTQTPKISTPAPANPTTSTPNTGRTTTTPKASLSMTPRYISTPTPQDYSCGSTSTAPDNWSGSGTITSVSPDYLMVDNKLKVNIGRCTKKSFSSSTAKSYKVGNHVTYLGYRGTDNQFASSGWARSLSFK